MSKFQKYTYILLAGLAIAGVLLELIVTAQREGTAFDNTFVRLLNFFSYFTAWMNVLVAGTSLYLMKSMADSKLYNSIRLSTLAGLGVTMLTHYLFLAGPLEGLPMISDLIIHTLVPGLYIIAWFILGPAVRVSRISFLLSLIIPTVWLFLALVRGILTGWYPYEFIDIQLNGVLRTALNLVMLYGVLCVGVVVVWLRDKSRSPMVV